MNGFDVIIGLVLISIITWILYGLIKGRRKSGSCGNCSGCSGCSSEPRRSNK